MPVSAAQLFEMLKKLHDSAVDLTPALTFDKTHKLHAATVSYYSSIVELSGACCALLGGNHAVAFPIVLRAFFEAHVDLMNLIRDPKYGYTLEIDFFTSRQRLLKLAKEGKIAYLAEITSKDDLDERLTATAKKLQEVKQKGKQLNISEKFAAADMGDEYSTLYAWLCSHSHNNLSAMTSRHVEEGEDGAEMVMYKEIDLEEYGIWIGVACELLLRSMEKIHGFLKSGKEDALKGLRAELDKLRDTA